MFERLNSETGVTVIIVTHDPAIAEKCRRVIRLVDGLIVEDRKAA
jgi:predicted ABC-type transport system involved in lysophospholipase L1 biosynthesis ATPase subunit